MEGKYRPSNGLEGDYFMDEFCRRCEHDDAYNTRGNGEVLCEIIPLTLIHQTTEPEYPAEWIYRDGLPTCTAFAEHIPSELELAKLEAIRKANRRAWLKRLPRLILRYRPKWYQDKSQQTRLRIAQYIHDRKPETCWAEWVSWAFGHCSLRDALESGSGCKADAKKDGACYCGQFNPENTI